MVSICLIAREQFSEIYVQLSQYVQLSVQSGSLGTRYFLAWSHQSIKSPDSTYQKVTWKIWQGRFLEIIISCRVCVWGDVISYTTSLVPSKVASLIGFLRKKSFYWELILGIPKKRGKLIHHGKPWESLPLFLPSVRSINLSPSPFQGT